MAGPSPSRTDKLPLSRYLATVRKSKALSLREAEKATGQVVSNAYLSQIENGYIKRPSPNILLALAEVYEVSYADLMERAGFTAPREPPKPDRRHMLLATFKDEELTEEEQAELVEYLGFMRSRKKAEEQTS